MIFLIDEWCCERLVTLMVSKFHFSLYPLYPLSYDFGLPPIKAESISHPRELLWSVEWCRSDCESLLSLGPQQLCKFLISPLYPCLSTCWGWLAGDERHVERCTGHCKSADISWLPDMGVNTVKIRKATWLTPSWPQTEQ